MRRQIGTLSVFPIRCAPPLPSYFASAYTSSHLARDNFCTTSPPGPGHSLAGVFRSGRRDVSLCETTAHSGFRTFLDQLTEKEDERKEKDREREKWKTRVKCTTGTAAIVNSNVGVVARNRRKFSPGKNEGPRERTRRDLVFAFLFHVRARVRDSEEATE